MQPVINEFVFNHTGSDTNEFVEILGDPLTDLSNFWLLQIEGDSNASTGAIVSATQLGTTNDEGYVTTGFVNGQFQNGSSTLLLVENFTGTVGDDIDTSNDGAIDNALWSNIVDSVAVNDGGGSDLTYSETVLTAGFDGGQFTPGGASRIPDGTDTDTAADWVRNDFDLAGVDGFPGSLAEGEAVNTPGAENTTELEPVDVDAPFMSIFEIQGAGHRSAVEGEVVQTSGVVTAIDSSGYYIQDIIGDGDIATSDAIFVAGDPSAVSIGDGVLVTGSVIEARPASRANDLTVTQIVAAEVSVEVDNLDLPDAVILGEGGRLPPTEVVEDDAFGSFDPETDGIDFYESLEGMRVTLPDAQATSATNRFGEAWAVANQGDNATGIHNRGGIQLTEGDNNPEKMQIQLDSGILPGFSPAVNVGDDLGDVTGVVDYSFGNFELKPTEEFTVTPGAAEREETELVGTDDQLTIASYNVLNLDPDATDGSDDVGNGQFERLAQQIVNNLKSPDVIALQEIQDNNGTNTGGDLSADVTLQMLVDAIVAAGGPEYEFVDVDPEFENQQGGQPGGNIRNAYLYNPERTSLVEDSLTALTPAVLTEAGVSNPDAFNGSRIPLLAQWEFNGHTVTTINNHLSSKFGSTPVYGDTQPFIDAGLEERKAQSLALNEFVSGELAEDADAKIVVLGDHNDFEFAEPQAIIESGNDDTQELFDQINTIDQLDGRYTFNFEGNSQVLDHLLVTQSLNDKTEFDIVHVNNDFGDAASTNPAVSNGAASDHEPILARLTLEPVNPLPPAPQPTNEIVLEKIGGFEGDGAEILAHDPASQRIFVTNGSDDSVDVLDISDPTEPTKIATLDLPEGVEVDDITSVAASQGVIAVAAPAETPENDGQVFFFTNAGFFLGSVEVGNLPDAVTFTPDGSKLLVANEGEPLDDSDPDGSVSIIDLSGGFVGLDEKVKELDFTVFNGREEEFKAKGIRIPDGATVAQALEPENIAVAPNGKIAMVTLQEANALALLDLEAGEVKDIIPLGVKDHSKGQPVLTNIDLTDSLPTLGVTEAGQEIKLGGLSGLDYAGTTDDGKLVFYTVPDRGPNPDSQDVDGDGGNERPFALPDYQARVHKIEVDPETGEAEFTDTILLRRFDNLGQEQPISGLPNVEALDEEPVDANGNPLPYDPFGADLEGVVVDSGGNFWMVDEYRPAIYKFNPDGILLNRFIPEGTAEAQGGVPANTFGLESLPEDYLSRRPNRGFEAMALDEEGGVLYAFIQTPLANPDRATSDDSNIIRILGIDVETGEPVAEYVYLLEDPAFDVGSQNVDKIGDAVYSEDGKIFVIERDSSTEHNAKKPIFEIDLTHATNLLADDAPELPDGRTLESLSVEELVDLGIDAVNKTKVLNLPSIGYNAGDKPEGLTLLPDGRLAVINDNDFSLTGDLNTETGEVGLTDETLPVVLGLIDFNDSNRLDASDRDGGINLQNYPIFGMYQPDGIAAFETDGKTYFATANEGDARDEDVRLKDLVLDPEAFPDAEELQKDENLGRLEVSSIDGDLDGDGDIDQIFAFGGRSFSIWDDRGNLVFDSGDDFARIIAEQRPDLFNSQGEADSFDNRSDNKGPEPEGIAVGEIDGETFVFVGLERVGGVMVYKVSDPKNPEFVQYINTANEDGTATDISPEGLVFISAEDSPNGEPMLAVAHEESGTTALYQIDVPPKEPAFTLQILHASDLEGGVDAIESAPNFAAIADFLEDTHENSITLSAGDNYLPGPFLNAASDRSFRDDGVFNDVYNELFGLTGNDVYAGLREGGGRVDVSIMNIIGFDASAVGNHEFDLGSDTFESIIEEDFRGDGLGDDRWVGAQFPYLSANLDFSGDADLGNLFTDQILVSDAFKSGPEQSAAGDGNIPKIAPATIIEEGGERIGVLGATTQVLESISSPSGTTVIGPKENDMPALAAILQPIIDQMVEDGVNKIILVSHLQQIALEQELATLLHGIDVIIAGGSDTLLADEEDVERGLQDGDTPAGDYPFTTTNADGDPVVVVSTDGEYSYVGRLVVDFDEDGVLILDEEGKATDEDVSGVFATTDEQVEALWGDEDPFAEGTKADLVEDLVEVVSGVVQEQDGNIFGSSDVFLDGRRTEVRTEETNFGNLTADANLAVAQAFDDTVEVSIKNGGGIRAPIGEVDSEGNFLPPQANPDAGKEDGDISQLDIANSLRFNNALTALTLTSEQLLAVLEHAVAASAEGATPGQFGQFGGISFSFDPSQPAGERIVSAALIDEDGNPTEALVENGEIVDAGRNVRIVTLSFLADGGDSYPFQDFVNADPTFANRVDLADAGLEEGDANFAAAGTEQDALAEFLLDNFSDTPFGEEETAPEDDTRIQNLSVREDTVLDGIPDNSDAGEGSEGNDGVGDVGGDEGEEGEAGETIQSQVNAALEMETDGTETSDAIFGLWGDDKLRGHDGNDLIKGGDGNDRLYGGEGDDNLEGGNDNDILKGGEGDDDLDGGAGNDILQGGEGADVLEGGLGDDVLLGGEDEDIFVFSAGDGRDVLRDFEPGIDTITLDGFDSATVDAAIANAEETDQALIITLDEAAGDRLVLEDVRKDDLSEGDIVI